MSTCLHISCFNYAIVSKKLSDPATWTCDTCSSNTESVWVCLQCAHIGCGRSCRHKHAQKHFSTSQHPVVLAINSGMVFCYFCEDWVLNDTHSGEIGLLREQLDRLMNQTFQSSRTRKGSVIRGPLTQFKFVDQVGDEDQPGFSRDFTAKRHYVITLLRRCVFAWRSIKDFQGANSVCNTAPTSPVKSNVRFKGRTGLRNIGNTCYQNATLTCLSSISVLKSIMAPLKCDDDTVEPNSKRQKTDRKMSEALYAEAQQQNRRGIDDASHSLPSVLTQLHKLFRIMWSGKWAGISPAFFVKSFMMAVPSFRGYIQHDAHEFLTVLLDTLEEEGPQNVAAKDIHRAFTSALMSRTTCHDCKTESIYKAPGSTCITLDLSATVERLMASPNIAADVRYPKRRASLYSAHPRTCSLEDCLQDMTAPLVLSGACQYRCDGNTCKGQLVDATKFDSYAYLATCVVFHINRTKWDNRGKRKVVHTLNFPLRDLDLTLLLSPGKHSGACRRYNLKGVVLHHGPDIDQGHYTAITLNSAESEYVAFNDLSSEVITEQDLIDRNYDGHPYLLFYEIQSS